MEEGDSRQLSTPDDQGWCNKKSIVQTDCRDIGSDSKRRAEGESPRQLEEQQSSHSGPVCVRGFPKASNQPRSERNAELCLLVSSETSMDKENLEGLLGHFPNPQFMVLALMNRCAQSMVSELVLLLPLLFRLRQPGADANKVGPSVEEANWSGLESVYYRPFRENIQSHLTKGSECVSKHPYFPKTDDAFLFKKNT
ncbi:hypothetical protein F7725_014696 [Dissostichus mawsoni]|uniref:Uncharacterized protein n=1 Tax=Dissostichus mawsoni TaxID=36200 RepID=A0A7J5Z106_DISMA|nr:hypothetical protein F7725_014696 [Dissostichus mawsoni]